MKKNKESFWSKYGYAIGMGLTLGVKIINLVNELEYQSNQRKAEEDKKLRANLANEYAYHYKEGKEDALYAISWNCDITDRATGQKLEVEDIEKKDWYKRLG